MYNAYVEYVIVGFDPASTRNIGWSSFTLSKDDGGSVKVSNWDGGTFVMPNTEERWQVLWPMFVTIESFLTAKQPKLVIVEKTSSFSGGFITGQVSQCMGSLLSACGKTGFAVEFVYPTSVKKLVAGNGRAKKPLMKKSVSRYLESLVGLKNFKFDSEHAADAAANVLYWLLKNEIIAPLPEE